MQRFVRAPWARVAGIIVATLLILIARRGDQLFHPQVWDEEGVIILRDLFYTGPASLIEPIAGYLILVPRLISFVALSISVTHYPLIATILAWAFIVAVICALACSPLVLRGGALLAIVTLLVPSNSEVFGVALYAFWWAALLIFVAALWQLNDRRIAWRLAFVLIGGLSSPIVVLAAPLFAFRAVVFRKNRAEWLVGAVGIACAVLQVVTLWRAHIVADRGSMNAAHTIGTIFFGHYFVGNLIPTGAPFYSAVVIASAIFTVMVIGVALWSGRRDAAVLLAVLYLWFGAILLSAGRVNVLALHPVLAGPRYFFYPYVFEGWFLLQVAFLARAAWVRSAAVALIALATINALPVLGRSHIDLHWRENVANCAQAGDFEPYAIPVEMDGTAATTWTLTLTGGLCRQFLSRDVLLRAAPLAAPPALPYVVRDPADAAGGAIVTAGSVVSNGWNGTDYQHSRPPGLVVVGSFLHGDVDKGSLTLRLHRGDRVLFRTGPRRMGQHVIIAGAAPGAFGTIVPLALEWTSLEFSNPSLPAEFSVVFEDDSSDWGEWSAVALASRTGVRRYVLK
ncbi:MAG: hypothetical protein JWO66_295 [Candidatus Eremiobacteraeota bacterium]|nr:hypothetical protein [Candidatus Eremiobacteraeota bacterium]